MDDKFDDYFNDNNAAAPDSNADAPKVETAGEREERKLEEATIERSHNWFRTSLVTIIVLVIVGAVIWLWQLYWRPYSQEVRKGYITAVKLQGNVFKTYEATMLEVSYVGNGFHIDDTVQFSITEDSIAIAAQMFQGNGKRVAVGVKQYKASLPWRGDSKLVASSLTAEDGQFGTANDTTISENQ